jgi:two-component system, NarL family, invasion response regulator UvrY
MSATIQIALADDHVMIRKAIAAMVESFGNYKVVLQASNGLELLDMLITADPLPDLVLLDIQMPQLNGIETAKILFEKYPEVKVIALTMQDNESSIIAMVKNGARGYLLKDAEPEQLREALDDVYHKGFHYSEIVTGRLVHQLQHSDTHASNNSLANTLSPKETEFLKWCCTELTYKEIAGQMHVSPRTVDGYRDQLFEKLGVKSRVGLAMFVVRMGSL